MLIVQETHCVEQQLSVLLELHEKVQNETTAGERMSLTEFNSIIEAFIWVQREGGDPGGTCRWDRQGGTPEYVVFAVVQSKNISSQFPEV